jgi:AbrB family transcriptional regulator (stage V sporulation protein T)
MKATGIVRRIDDLGRVVIPREIRRICKIKEGDPLEIFLSEGGIFLKKYSELAILQDYVNEYVSALHETTNYPVYITNTEHIISVSGMPKKGNLGKEIEDDVVKSINEYKESFMQDKIIIPIISDGERAGAVVMMCNKTDDILTELELKLVQTAAKFLGNMLNYAS